MEYYIVTFQYVYFIVCFGKNKAVFRCYGVSWVMLFFEGSLGWVAYGRFMIFYGDVVASRCWKYLF